MNGNPRGSKAYSYSCASSYSKLEPKCIVLVVEAGEFDCSSLKQGLPQGQAMDALDSS